MPDSLQALLQTLALDSIHVWVTVAALAGLFMLSYGSFTPARQRWRENRQIARAIKQLGARVLRNARLPDGLGGEVTIEYLLLTRDAIMVMDLKRYDGLIFGGSQTDDWTQVINTRSYRFANPDDFLKSHIVAVRTLLPKTTVTGRHLFTSNASFPKGKPENVLLVSEVCNQSGRTRYKDIPKELRTAWKALNEALS